MTIKDALELISEHSARIKELESLIAYIDSLGAGLKIYSITRGAIQVGSSRERIELGISTKHWRQAAADELEELNGCVKKIQTVIDTAEAALKGMEL